MEYAEGFKDLPLDSTELVTDCRMAAFHLGSNIQQCSMLHIFKQSQFKQLTKKKLKLAYIVELHRQLLPYMALA